MTDGFVSVDREWHYTVVNPRAEQLIGRPAAELLGKSMEELFPDMEGWSHYRTVMAERRPETFEVWSRPLEVWLEVHAYPTADGVSILFSDIRLKAAAEELRLHNADLAERAHFADSLNAINRLLHATLDFGTIMQGALDEGVEALEAAAGLIEMREESQWVMRYQNGWPRPNRPTTHARRATLASPLRSAASRLHQRPPGCRGAHRVRRRLRAAFSARRASDRHGAVLGASCLTTRSGTPSATGSRVRSQARGIGSLALANARLYEEQQRIAPTLQENFLHELPTVAGLELGMVTKTANEPELVGGDFSDVFVLDDTHVVVLIGDVAGKGVRAAGLTETVRSTVRALAAVDSSPAFILARPTSYCCATIPTRPM